MLGSEQNFSCRVAYMLIIGLLFFKVFPPKWTKVDHIGESIWQGIYKNFKFSARKYYNYNISKFRAIQNTISMVFILSASANIIV